MGVEVVHRGDLGRPPHLEAVGLELGRPVRHAGQHLHLRRRQQLALADVPHVDVVVTGHHHLQKLGTQDVVMTVIRLGLIMD